MIGWLDLDCLHLNRLHLDLRRCRGSALAACVLAALAPGATFGATIAPPLLDITRHCDAIARRNVTAMSECIVAESEARAEILQKWAKLSDAAAERCVQIGRKTRRYPYATMAKCLAAEPAGLQAKAPPAR